MFTWLNKQGVVSDKGFIVQSINRFVIEYRESSNIIRFSVDRGLLENGVACVYIYRDELEKWDNGASIPKGKQEEILKNFKDAMEFQGVEVLID